MEVFVLLALFAALAYGSPVSQPEAIAPAFDAYSDVRFLLQTRKNPRNPQQLLFRDLLSVQQSHFNRNLPLRVLFHAWWDDVDNSDLNGDTAAELLNYNDFNVIFVDWTAGSRTINYAEAVNRVPTVGNFVASYLDFLHENGFIQYSRVGFIGFSLGAHTAGFTAKSVRRGRVNFIIGLDPANLFFSERNPDGRLDAGDADYVEVIHTNGPTLLLTGMGIGRPIGHADFWPNGGQSQPGCLTNTCSHGRSVTLYMESIRNNGFYARRCPARDDISARRCTIVPGAWMGGDAINFSSLRGSFYLETNRNSPFAQGPTRP